MLNPAINPAPRTTSVQFDEGLYQTIRTLAHEYARPFGEQVRVMLREALDQRAKWKMEKDLIDAKAEADRIEEERKVIAECVEQARNEMASEANDMAKEIGTIG